MIHLHVLHTENTQSPQTASGVLVSQNANEQQSSQGGNPSNRDNQHNREVSSNQDSKGHFCYYYYELVIQNTII